MTKKVPESIPLDHHKQESYSMTRKRKELSDLLRQHKYDDDKNNNLNMVVLLMMFPDLPASVNEIRATLDAIKLISMQDETKRLGFDSMETKLTERLERKLKQAPTD